MSNVFEIKNMNLYYGDYHALKNINMEIEKNKVTALIGPSGCGKSTFLRSLNRMNDLVPETRIRGSLLFEGEELYGEKTDPIKLRTKVGMVFQKANPFPKSIYDNIVYGPKIHGIKDKAKLDSIVQKTLTEVGLWDEVKDRLGSSAMGLSGGQQQRLCIARCLAVNPEVILMDEPTSALDPIATAKIEELIENLSKDYTIVIVTHNMQQARRISHKTAFFLLGELVEFAGTEEVFERPKSKKTEDYVLGRFG